MARNLTSTLNDAFRNYNTSCCWHTGNIPNVNSSERYMEIPINKDVFEIPLFAISAFNEAINKGNEPESIIVVLNTENRDPGYKTLDRNMRDVLKERFDVSRLVAIPVKDGNNTLMYYGTQGAIFSDYFTPLMMCSWLVEKYQVTHTIADSASGKFHNEEITEYKLTRPLFRINPDVYRTKGDSMERYLAGKTLNTILDLSFLSVHIPGLCSRISTNDRAYNKVKVEIDKSPFIIHDPDVPSASISNKELLQLAIDHIDEVLRCQ